MLDIKFDSIIRTLLFQKKNVITTWGYTTYVLRAGVQLMVSYSDYTYNKFQKLSHL